MDMANMSLADLYAKVNSLTERVIKIDTKFAAFFTAGVLFWGITQTLIFRKLDELDSTVASVNQLTTDINLIQYRQNQQDVLNQQLVQRLAEQKQEADNRYESVSSQLNQIRRSPTIHTGN